MRLTNEYLNKILAYKDDEFVGKKVSIPQLTHSGRISEVRDRVIIDFESSVVIVRSMQNIARKLR